MCKAPRVDGLASVDWFHRGIHSALSPEPCVLHRHVVLFYDLAHVERLNGVKGLGGSGFSRVLGLMACRVKKI